jgi:hypothetical protein
VPVRQKKEVSSRIVTQSDKSIRDMWFVIFFVTLLISVFTLRGQDFLQLSKLSTKKTQQTGARQLEKLTSSPATRTSIAEEMPQDFLGATYLAINRIVPPLSVGR